MIKSTVAQIRILLAEKTAVFTFLFLFGLVLANYFINVFTYAGMDVSEMYRPTEFLLLANQGKLGFYFLEYYPLLVIVPAAFSYYNDRTSREKIYLEARMGKSAYYVGKVLSVFLVTFVVFSLPFLMEIALNCIAFPMEADEFLNNVDIYSNAELVQHMFSWQFYVYHPYLYSVVFTLVFGAVSGILAVFTLAFSTLRSVKLKVFLFLPCYLLAYGLTGLQPVVAEYTIHYISYLALFDYGIKNTVAYVLLLMVFLLVSISVFFYQSRKDEC